MTHLMESWKSENKRELRQEDEETGNCRGRCQIAKNAMIDDRREAITNQWLSEIKYL